ncbi:MAG: hypothetical protein JO097_06155, partial [Acidobacteriaceae bacterium]|nr:hypothetical protein [Acidobacteriaceae bacterium]
MCREPLVFPALAFAAGILVGHFFFFKPADLLLPALLHAIPFGLAFATTKGFRMRLPAVCAALALAGIATQVAHRPTRTPKLNADDGETVLLSGCITNPPVLSPNREQFTLNLTPQAAARLSVALKLNEALSVRY